MPGSIVVTNKSVLSSGPHQETISPTTFTIRQDTRGVFSRSYTLTGSESDVDLSSLTAPGLVWLTNIGDGDSIIYGPKSGGVVIDFGEILPGHAWPYYHAASVTLRVKARVSSAVLLVQAYER